MSKVSIELDLAIVQKAIHAKVQPAVDQLLATCDVPNLIAKRLLQPIEVDRYGSIHAIRRMIMFNALGGGPSKDGEKDCLLAQLVEQGIRETAQEYIKKSLAKDRSKIEAAFAKMLRDSPNKLASTLIGSLEGALKNEWSFELSTKVSPKEPDRDYD